jgi:beta-aspartyl-peptidase (threonine type)
MHSHSNRMALVVHGGAGNSKDNADGCAAAAREGFERLRAGGEAMDAAVAAVVRLENDGRFNAGSGSIFRSDGKTIETDAAVMDSAGRLGAVCCLQATRNPVLVALEVVSTPHWLLGGIGAQEFARARGFAAHDLAAGRRKPARACDTVGAVAVDSHGRFAVACSTGGSAPAMLGRVGDTPIPGAGFWAGPHGAVAATGVGEAIVPRMLARLVYQWIEHGMPLQQALDRGVALLPADSDVGLIGLTPDAAATSSNRSMPVHVIQHERD